MALIYESKNFVVQSAEAPLVDRNDGGHITIDPKEKMVDRQQLTPAQATELMRLTIVAGQAMTTAMNKNGVDIGRINYQDNGNWSVLKPSGAFLHIHLYGRAKSAVAQKYGQTLHFPHREEFPELYQSLKPLNAKDVGDIQAEMLRLFAKEKYSDEAWKI